MIPDVVSRKPAVRHAIPTRAKVDVFQEAQVMVLDSRLAPMYSVASAFDSGRQRRRKGESSIGHPCDLPSHSPAVTILCPCA